MCLLNNMFFTQLLMAEKKRIHFIINPISGTQKKDQIIADIGNYLGYNTL